MNIISINRDRSAVAISVVSAWEISWLVSWLAIYTGKNRGQCRDFTYSFTRSLARKDTLFDTIAWLDRGWAFVRMALAKGSHIQCRDGRIGVELYKHHYRHHWMSMCTNVYRAM